jgi:hypothetical protein
VLKDHAYLKSVTTCRGQDFSKFARRAVQGSSHLLMTLEPN